MAGVFDDHVVGERETPDQLFARRRCLRVVSAVDQNGRHVGNGCRAVQEDTVREPCIVSDVVRDDAGEGERARVVVDEAAVREDRAVEGPQLCLL